MGTAGTIQQLESRWRAYHVLAPSQANQFVRTRRIRLIMLLTTGALS